MILFTSDWQLSYANMGTVEKAVDQICQIIDKYSVRTVVHAGDLKHALNPIDGRVTNATIDIIQRIKSRGAEFLLNLGNHDKLTMSEGGDTWSPMVRVAGARVFTEPGETEYHGTRFFFLPYMNDSNKVVAAAQAFQPPKGGTKRNVLVFHASIKRSKANVLREYSGDDAISFGDLNPEKYHLVVGGHFHFQQTLGKNGWYIGSPFATDWGEANQQKGYLLMSPEGKVSRIKSVIPGWYDPKLPGFVKPTSWKGTSVRIRVPVEKKVVNVAAALAAAKIKAEQDYPQARIVVVPDMMETSAAGLKIARNASDEDVIAEYVKASLPEALEGQEKKLVSYLAFKLGEVASMVRSSSGVEFICLTGENVLSFEKLQIDYTTAGIRVISGINQDWEDRSNGSGKTSYLQVLSIALFGKTLKGQTADRWKRRGAGDREKSYVQLSLRLGDGREMMIFRGRTPKRTTVSVEGKDLSSGMGDRETQRVIETLTGLTWEILTNAMFLDQRELNRLLTGTDAERKAVLNQFLNLERYQKAQEGIKAEVRTVADSKAETHRDISTLEQGIESHTEFIRTLKTRKKADLSAIDKEIQDATERRDAARKLGREKKPLVDEVREASLVAGRRVSSMLSDRGAVGITVANLTGQIQKLTNLTRSATCPVCKQTISKGTIQEHVDELRKSLNAEEKKAKVIATALEAAKQDQEIANQKLQSILKEYTLAEANFNAAKEELGRLEARRDKASKEGAVDLKKYELELLTKKRDLARLEVSYAQFAHEEEFLSYAVKAFSKDGIPAYLSAQICPRLNRSAAYYSRLFADGEIQAQFAVTDDDIEVSILNEHGGEGIDDQSNGEMRIASLIVSFSLRDVMSPCNVLITDEPGEGLDERNARQFAAGLKELTDRFKVILVTTHNPHVLSELSDQTQVIIRKRNKVSRIEEK